MGPRAIRTELEHRRKVPRVDGVSPRIFQTHEESLNVLFDAHEGRPTGPDWTTFQQDTTTSKLTCKTGRLDLPKVRGNVPDLTRRPPNLVLEQRRPLSFTSQNRFALRHKVLKRLRLLIHFSNQLTNRQIRDRQVLCQRSFPRCTTGRIREDVRLPTNPDPHDVETLQFKRPIRHLLTASTVVKLCVRKDVILVIDVAIAPKALHELLMTHDTLPQREQLTLHG